MRIVIVGSGMAGLHVAESLREAGFDGAITLVGDEPHPPYSRPPLSKEFLTGKGGAAGIDLRPRDALEALDLQWHRGRRAVRLDPAQRALLLDDGEDLGYDRLVIATGAKARRPDTSLSGVHTLRTVEDARAVSRDFERCDRLVVVGAGFIGAEVASSARALGHEVTIVEAVATPMGRAVHPRIGRALAALHQDNGVELRLGAGVAGYSGDGRVARVHLDDGTALSAPMVVAGIGVVLNTGWLAGSGFGPLRPFTRMLRGPVSELGDPARTFAVAGPEFG
jgi:NADPH-dependent 2,4-dienoyl-CoA reductase/sulfur reductase-like enzyme